jgi:hypothetical protein
METKKIDLLKYRGENSTLFTGRPQGRQVRLELALDQEDKSTRKVIFIIPIGTTSLNPSFYLGLLFDSIEALGKDEFNIKYEIDYSTVGEDHQSIIQDDLDDGMRHALNSMTDDTGFGAFL